MAKRLKMVKGSGNIFHDIGFPPDEAQSLLLRADLMLAIERFVRKKGVAPKKAAKLLGITQRRLNLLLKHKIGLFTLDDLVGIAARAGMQVKLTVKKAA